jgi:hypothetical protein
MLKAINQLFYMYKYPEGNTSFIQDVVYHLPNTFAVGFLRNKKYKSN